MDAKTELAEIQKMKKEYEKAISERGTRAVRAAFAEFFAANPEVKLVYWNQYTPYFNDGEPCHFRVNEPEFGRKTPDEMEDELPPYGDEPFDGRIDGSDYEYVDDPTTPKDRWGYTAQKRVSKEPDPLAEACENFWTSIQNKDLFLAAFGDHVQVIITPNDVTIEEFNHD